MPFLEKRPTFMNIGKAAMAAELINREDTERIFIERGGLNWMQYLVGKMQGPSFEAFAENKVTFVTFNYDRVLEHYLCTALENAWGKTQDEVGTLLRKCRLFICTVNSAFCRGKVIVWIKFVLLKRRSILSGFA
jgi:hypothetical protein